MASQLFGLIAILISLAGLTMASGAVDDAMYVDGMIFAAFGVMVVFWLIGRSDAGRSDR
jgi:hypothetical protein